LLSPHQVCDFECYRIIIHTRLLGLGGWECDSTVFLWVDFFFVHHSDPFVTEIHVCTNHSFLHFSTIPRLEFVSVSCFELTLEEMTAKLHKKDQTMSVNRKRIKRKMESRVC